MTVIETKLIHRTSKGTLLRSAATMEFADGRIWFRKSPFALKDEIKDMAGSKWHGRDKPPKKIWSVDDCARNRFQLGFLMGEKVFAWFDRPLEKHVYREYYLKGKLALPMDHQFELADFALTYHYQLWAAEMGVGKTLAAQMVIEHSKKNRWYWIGPKSSLPNMRREFKMWGMDAEFVDPEDEGPAERLCISLMTYERLVRIMDSHKEGDLIPDGVVCDESSRCKTWQSQRTRAVTKLANLIRGKHNFDGYVIEMSGTPSPKRPTDWWPQCEIAWPGYLREGSVKALERRLAFQVQKQFDSGTFWQNIGWRDDEKKCNTCGEYLEAPCHHNDNFMDEDGPEVEYHPFEASKNEVAYMHERLKGLVVVKHLKDCVQLPPKRYRQVNCKPTASVLRVAKALVDSAANTMTGMTLLRELSDGFQYREEQDGMKTCPLCKGGTKIDEWFKANGEEEDAYKDISMLEEDLVAQLEKREVDCPRCNGKGEVIKYLRYAKELPCPKEKALRGLLDENEETGRLVVFAGFTGSVDRVTNICRKEGWAVVRCDGRGFQVTNPDGTVNTDMEPLDFWADLEHNPRVAFVAHPESGGMSLTLTEARMAVYWSNSFKPEYRIQSEARIYRKGMDENIGCIIVDLVHLPTDVRVLDIIRDNRKLELMTMGEITDDINWEDAAETEGIIEVSVT